MAKRLQSPSPSSRDVVVAVPVLEWMIPGGLIGAAWQLDATRMRARMAEVEHEEALKIIRERWHVRTRRAVGRPEKSPETALNELADAGILWLQHHPDATIDDLHGAELAEATFRKDTKTLSEHLRRHHLTMAGVKQRILERRGN